MSEQKPFDLPAIAKLTNMHPQDRADMLIWLARQPEEVQLEAVKLTLDKVKTFSNVQGRLVERFYAALILALRAMHGVERAMIDRNATPEEVKRLMVLRAQRIKAGRKKKPRKKLLMLRTGYTEEIRRLRQEMGLSWRQCAEYLDKHHGIKVSHGYLQRIFGDHIY